MGYIESWGRGIDKICDACEIAGLQKPVYDIDGNGIMLQIKANVDWDGNKIEYDKDGNRKGVTPQVTPQVNAKLTKLMKFCEKPRTRQEMQEIMGLKDKKNFVKNYIQPMVKLGIIKMTSTDKPKSQNQQYIMVRRD